MIQLGILLALVTSLLGAGVFIVNSIKESGREECRAEHQEAARMAELRSRERGDRASQSFAANQSARAARERAIAPEVASAVASNPGRCLDDAGLRVLNDDIREGRGSSESK